MNQKLFILFLFCQSVFYYTQVISPEKQRINHILSALRIKSENFEETVYSEKKMPERENQYIVCLPIVDTKDESLINYDLYVIICDTNGSILHKYFEKNAYTSDAIALDFTEVDTGMYTIKTNIRAFGIRAHFRNGSQPNPYSSEEISLFYLDDSKIKNILNHYQIDQSAGEWDLKCNGEFEESTGYISIEPTQNNGFYNLKIKTKIKKRQLIGKDKKTGDCKEKISQTFQTNILKFSKGQYR